MRKSKLLIFIKTAVITFGLLSLLSGLINPLTYFLGSETTIIIDNTSSEKVSDDLYLTTIDYHYFAKAREYSGKFSTKDTTEDISASKDYSIKYIPLFPEYEVVSTNYSFPIESIILLSVGLVSFIAGLFIKTTVKIKEKKEDVSLSLYLCPACEREIDKDSIFCNYCGRKILSKG